MRLNRMDVSQIYPLSLQRELHAIAQRFPRIPLAQRAKFEHHSLIWNTANRCVQWRHRPWGTGGRVAAAVASPRLSRGIVCVCSCGSPSTTSVVQTVLQCCRCTGTPNARPHRWVEVSDGERVTLKHLRWRLGKWVHAVAVPRLLSSVSKLMHSFALIRFTSRHLNGFVHFIIPSSLLPCKNLV